jgi:predicted nucleic acid-binding protein
MALILLDTGPLSLVTHPKGGESARACKVWLQEILDAGAVVKVPALSDYELRRELIRSGKQTSLDRLDALNDTLGYLPIGPDDLIWASHLWANARNRGLTTADDLALDGDCILAAQAESAPRSILPAEFEQEVEASVLIATTNPKHLARFSPARLWSEILPGTF